MRVPGDVSSSYCPVRTLHKNPSRKNTPILRLTINKTRMTLKVLVCRQIYQGKKTPYITGVKAGVDSYQPFLSVRLF
jgi:hypothetical protein